MNRLIPLIVLACVIVAAIGVVIVRGDGLPRSFVMTLDADLTSSGASRTYAATLDVDGTGISGTSRYVSDSGREERIEYACALAGGRWTNAEDGEACLIPLVIPTTRAELADAIKDEEIVPSDTCTHKQLCYGMLPR
jgi:hypothetical protein